MKHLLTSSRLLSLLILVPFASVPGCASSASASRQALRVPFTFARWHSSMPAFMS